MEEPSMDPTFWVDVAKQLGIAVTIGGMLVTAIVYLARTVFTIQKEQIEDQKANLKQNTENINRMAKCSEESTVCLKGIERTMDGIQSLLARHGEHIDSIRRDLPDARCRAPRGD